MLLLLPHCNMALVSAVCRPIIIQRWGNPFITAAPARHLSHFHRLRRIIYAWGSRWDLADTIFKLWIAWSKILLWNDGKHMLTIVWLSSFCINTFRSLKCSPAFLFKYYTHLNVSVVSLITQDGLDIVIALNIIPYIFMWLVWHACMRINKRRGRHTKWNLM